MMDDGDGDDVNDETYYILNTSAACASARSQMYDDDADDADDDGNRANDGSRLYSQERT